MKKILAAMALGLIGAMVPTVAEAAPVPGGAGADYGAHVADHARSGTGFSGDMNPGHHRGFAGFDGHHHH